VDASRENSEKLSESAERTDESVPEIAIHPVGHARGCFAQRNNCVRVEFVQPHFVFEEPKERGLRLFERIRFGGTISISDAGFAINPDAESHASRYAPDRNKKRRLN